VTTARGASGVYDAALCQTHVDRAKRTLPGPGYYAALAWIHRALQPATYVEIGVNTGGSLRMALSGTRCIGIDPAPTLDASLPATSRIFASTSDDFFRRHHLPDVLGSDHFSLAFIDGLHLFEHVLLDFVHLERFAGPDSVIVLHDCLPLDASTSARVRTTEFYSGDVWKAILCLRDMRRDLQMAIVPTQPTGLCIVSALDSSSAVLADRYASCLARYRDLTFDDYAAACADRMPPIIPNTKAAVMTYVRERRAGAHRVNGSLR
jgi:hypothetical protein